MKRPNHTIQGLLFVVACFLVGLLIYQPLAGRSVQTTSNTSGAIGNYEDDLTPVTGGQGAITSERFIENGAGSDEMTRTGLGPVPEIDPAENGRAADKSASNPSEGRDCEARILRRVSAIQDADAVKEAGEKWAPVTQFWHNERTDDMWYCAHGDYCYPAWVRENGTKVKAIELINCLVQSDKADRDGDETMYPVGE